MFPIGPWRLKDLVTLLPMLDEMAILGLLTYADVCCRMLTYADVCRRVLSYADVCRRMLTYADVCCDPPCYARQNGDSRCSVYLLCWYKSTNTD